jgi:hypothetical protein
MAVGYLLAVRQRRRMGIVLSESTVCLAILEGTPRNQRAVSTRGSAADGDSFRIMEVLNTALFSRFGQVRLKWPSLYGAIVPPESGFDNGMIARRIAVQPRP